MVPSGPRREHPLLDQLVGGGQQRFRDGKAERLGGLQVDDQLDFCDLLHRQIGRLLALVWGSGSQALYFTAFSTSFIPVSLFDLKSRFFAPTHMCWRPARAGAVKAGRRSTLATRSVFPGRALIDPSTAARSVWSG